MARNEPAVLAPSGKRERGLAERRKRLVHAARELISERDDGSFSMQELATRAGLALATPYNLFGSKAKVLEQVFLQELQEFHRKRWKLGKQTPVNMIMGIVDQLAVALFKRPQFFRNLSREMFTLGPGDLSKNIGPVSEMLLRPLVAELIEIGAVDKSVPAEIISLQLQLTYSASFSWWAVMDPTYDQFRSQMRACFALTFLAALSGEDRTRLYEILAQEAVVINSVTSGNLHLADIHKD